MRSDSEKSGNLVLPEYQNMQQIFATLRDKVIVSGHPHMGTFLCQDEICGLMVVGKMSEIINLSRIIATIGQSPLVDMLKV